MGLKDIAGVESVQRLIPKNLVIRRVGKAYEIYKGILEEIQPTGQLVVTLDHNTCFVATVKAIKKYLQQDGLDKSYRVMQKAKERMIMIQKIK